MGADTTLTPEEQYHVEIMTAIVRGLKDTPYVLKGGTALLLGYGLDRFSEDLDFDAEKPLNLEAKIRACIPDGTEILTIRNPKQTKTVSRYVVQFTDGRHVRSLKIETSMRTPCPAEQINIINGMQISSVSRIIDGKLGAMEGRTAIRDLYDMDFLLRRYPSEFSDTQKTQLKMIFRNGYNIFDEYLEAYTDDPIISNRIELEDLVSSIATIIAGFDGSLGPCP